MSIVNKPRVSKTITGMYWGLAAFIGCIGLIFLALGILTPMGNAGFIAGSLILVFVEPILLLVIASLYRTRYILSDSDLLIRTTILIGGDKRIPLDEVESVEKTLIPFGIRFFGASFHGGHYRIPGLGRSFIAMTNFEDGLLIRTKHRNYIITPRDPEDFKEAIELKIHS